LLQLKLYSVTVDFFCDSFTCRLYEVFYYLNV